MNINGLNNRITNVGIFRPEPVNKENSSKNSPEDQFIKSSSEEWTLSKGLRGAVEGFKKGMSSGIDDGSSLIEGYNVGTDASGSILLAGGMANFFPGASTIAGAIYIALAPVLRGAGEAVEGFKHGINH